MDVGSRAKVNCISKVNGDIGSSTESPRSANEQYYATQAYPACLRLHQREESISSLILEKPVNNNRPNKNGCRNWRVRQCRSKKCKFLMEWVLGSADRGRNLDPDIHSGTWSFHPSRNRRHTSPGTNSSMCCNSCNPRFSGSQPSSRSDVSTQLGSGFLQKVSAFSSLSGSRHQCGTADWHRCQPRVHAGCRRRSWSKNKRKMDFTLLLCCVIVTL